MASLLQSRSLLIAWGTLAVLVGAFSAYDATRPRATDGAVWLLGGDQIRVVGIEAGRAADRAGLEIGDIIEGIDRQAIRNPRHASELLRNKQAGDSVPYLFRRDGEVQEALLTLDSTRMANVGIYLVYCLVGLIYFIAGSYIYYRSPGLVAARLFFVLCTMFLIYFFSVSERSIFYYWSDLFIRNMGTLASLMLPPLFLHFFLVFPKRRSWLERMPWAVPLLYALPVGFYLDFSWNQFFGDSAAAITAAQQLALGFYFTAGLTSLVRTYVASGEADMRQRVKFLTLGTVFGTLPFLVFNIALGRFVGQSEWSLMGAVPMILVPVSFGYSIARYRLMDIEVFIRRSLMYALLTGLTVGAYLVLVVLVGHTILDVSGQNSQLVAIVATLLIAAAFAPARERIQGFLEHRFFREKHDLQQALQDLARALPHTLEREALIRLVETRVSELLHPSTFLFLSADADVLRIPTPSGDTTLLHFSRMLRRRGSAANPEVVQSELLRLARKNEDSRDELREEIQLLEREAVELVVPAFAGERLVGALALGAKRSEVAYDGAETDMLQIVAGQMGVQLENSRLYDSAVEQKRLEEELGVARDIQQRLLPSDVPQIDGYELAAVNLPSAQVSGDYFDFVNFGDCTGLVIADVSGKGLPASLLASNLQASIRALASSKTQPGEVLRIVNDTLHASTDSARFATAFLACLHCESGAITYSNAGHNPPLLRRADGTVEWLDVGSTPLGAFPGMSYDEAHVRLNPGDCLVLYTDGVTEAESPGGEFFGEEGLEAAVHAHCSQSAETMLRRLRDSIEDHTGPIGAADDLTVIVVRMLSTCTVEAGSTKIGASPPALGA